jgi:hypothetical protein
MTFETQSFVRPPCAWLCVVVAVLALSSTIGVSAYSEEPLSKDPLAAYQLKWITPLVAEYAKLVRSVGR